MIRVAVSSHWTVVFLLRWSLPRVSLQSWAETTCLEPGAHQDLEIGGKKEGKLKILSLVSTACPWINLSIKKLKGCSCSTQAIKRIKIPAKFKVSTTSPQYFWPWLVKIHFNNIRRKCPSRLLTLFGDLWIKGQNLVNCFPASGWLVNIFKTWQ